MSTRFQISRFDANGIGNLRASVGYPFWRSHHSYITIQKPLKSRNKKEVSLCDLRLAIKNHLLPTISSIKKRLLPKLPYWPAVTYKALIFSFSPLSEMFWNSTNWTFPHYFAKSPSLFVLYSNLFMCYDGWECVGTCFCLHDCQCFL